jgi:hypothetical protein
VTVDGAYDGATTYQTAAEHGAHIRIVIPPHVTAVLSDEAGHGPSQRDGHIALIEAKGRLEWQKATGCGRRSLAETRWVDTNGLLAQLRARSFAGQQTEVAIGVAVLNRMLEAGRPDSIRSSKNTA